MAAQVLAALVAVAILIGLYKLLQWVEKMLVRTGATQTNARNAAFVGIPFILIVLGFLAALVLTWVW